MALDTEKRVHIFDVDLNKIVDGSVSCEKISETQYKIVHGDYECNYVCK